MKTIKLTTPAVVTSHLPFLIGVDLRGPPAGSHVRVRIDQKRGDERATPLYEAVIAHGGGDVALATFKVTLGERGTVILLATAEDESGAPYHPDCAVIDVV